MRGRRPSLETIQKRLAGTYSGPPPACPEWLDPDAKMEWDRVVPEMVIMGILTPVDCMTLAVYCQTYSQWKKAEQQVRADGLMVLGAGGTMVLHPCARHAAKLLSELRRTAADFGFTPASRARVETANKPGEEQDAFDNFNMG